MLEFAILGLLHEAPMHGYELRKRLHELLGAFRAFSYGTLYPTLRRLQRDGYLVEESPEELEPSRTWTRRARKVYKLTTEGKERFTELIAAVDAQTWDDDAFGIHLAFFSRTPAEVRMRVLEGRRRRVEERREGLRSSLSTTSDRIDRYTRELHRMGLESTEREVRWLNELIAQEQAQERNQHPHNSTRPDPD